MLEDKVAHPQTTLPFSSKDIPNRHQQPLSLREAMSRASKLTLMGTSLFAVTTVIFVHFQQKAEKAAMHEGVVRDIEQQRVKRERQLDFELQRALEQEYKKGQTVRDTTGNPSDDAR